MAERYDAIVIGGGHNGLVTAAYLARAGMRTVVLERRHVLGGAAVTEEIVPGFRFSVASYVVSLLRPEIVRELELPRHGLEILPLDGTLTPLDDDYLWRVNDHGRTVRELRRWSRSDAEAYEEYSRLMVQMARFIKPILSAVPPDQGRPNPLEWLPLAGLARSFAGLPRRLKDTFIQLMTMSAADFLDQWFETDPLKATMSASGIIGTFQGVRSPGTAYVLLHHYMGEIDGAFRAWGIPRGGTGGVSLAIASAARAQGAEIRTEAPVARIDVQGGRAAGVTLESGETLAADIVLSSADARVTLIDLLEPGRSSRRRCAGTSSADRRARSTWRWTGCPTSPACPGRASICGGRSASRRRSSTWSEPTTTPSTAGRPSAPTSTRSSRRWSIRRWRPPASTS
jgi:phytoene dehydrogenase-like protein